MKNLTFNAICKPPKMQANYFISILNTTLKRNTYELSNYNNW